MRGRIVLSIKAKGLALCLFCCFLALARGGWASAGVVHPYSAPTLKQNIDYSERLLNEGKAAQAVELLGDLYPRSSGRERVRIEFLLGLIAAGEGDYKTAETVFRKILQNNPGHTRARLELALVYYRLGKDDKADYHLRLALSAAGLPAQVRRNIMALLADIRYRKSWDYYISLGIAPSSNVNNASGVTRECLDFFGIPLCRRLEGERSSLGISGAAGVEHNLRISPRWRLRSAVDFTLADHAGGGFDNYGAGLSFGPRYTFGRGEAGLYAGAGKMWYGGRQFESDFGPVFVFSYDISRRLSFGFNAAHKRQFFDDFDYMQGYNTALAPMLYYGLSQKSYLLLKPGVNFLRTREDWADKDTLSLALGFGTELPWGVSLYAEPAFSWARGRGDMLVLDGGTLAYKTRSDNGFNFNLRLLQRAVNLWGFTPTLNYYYSRVSSNIQNMSYDKHTVELGAIRRF